MSEDRFGNPFAPGLAYARGRFVSSTADDMTKLRVAGTIMRERRERLGPDALYLLSGLERSLRVDPSELEVMDDEIASALYFDEVRQLGLEHLGGDPDKHDVVVLNRLTAALLVSADVMINQGEEVIGVSPRYSHPAVVRAVAHARARFRDVQGLPDFKSVMADTRRVNTVFLTRLAVSYEILGEDELREIVRVSREKGAQLIVDDAGGARVGPAVFGQSKPLELGVDVCATGLDKYGTSGPRLGLLAGRKDLVERIRVRAFEMGLEARQMLYPAVVRSLKGYDPARVRELVATTMLVAAALKKRIAADRIFETPVTVQLRGEDIIELAMARGGLTNVPVVPYEATAGLAMLLLREYGIITVHFAGIPPGTSAFMIKFVPPETLARLGGAERLADAIDECIGKLGEVLRSPEDFSSLILGTSDSLGRAA